MRAARETCRLLVRDSRPTITPTIARTINTLVLGKPQAGYCLEGKKREEYLQFSNFIVSKSID